MSMKTKNPKIILASGSPRRKEILEKMGVEFEVIPSGYEEDMTLPLSPEELVKKLAHGKAEEVARKFPEAIIIGADTIVVSDGKVLGKPHTKEAAVKMLTELSGKTHGLVTGLAIIHFAGKCVIREAVPAKISFKILTAETIREYVETGEPLDKAGAYAVQGLGGKLIEKIEGDYWSVVGLPARVLAEHLGTFGINAKLI